MNDAADASCAEARKFTRNKYLQQCIQSVTRDNNAIVVKKQLHTSVVTTFTYCTGGTFCIGAGENFFKTHRYDDGPRGWCNSRISNGSLVDIIYGLSGNGVVQ